MAKKQRLSKSDLIEKPLSINNQYEQEIVLISKLSELEKFCLDGYILSELDEPQKVTIAYRLSRPKGSEAKEQSIYVQARRWFNSESCQTYIKVKKRNVVIGGNEDSEDVDISKEQYQKLVNKHLTLADRSGDSKTVKDLVSLQANLEQWNKQDITDEESKINFYRPLKCSECQLYKSAKMTKSKSE